MREHPLNAASRLLDRTSNWLIWKLAPKDRMVATRTPIVSFTFDDVPDTALIHGARILEKYDLLGTFYIAGGLEGRVEPDRTLITRQGCLELFRRGHEIGAHTFSHRPLRAYGQGLGNDLDQGDHYIRTAGITSPITNFAYPYNAAWPTARRALRARYRTARGAGHAINRGPVDPLMLKSVEIRQPEEDAFGLTAWIDELVTNPGWLIFFTHDIADKPTPYGCTPGTFEHLVRYTVEQNCRVMTVEAATRELGWETGQR